jgi:hypothetical protein
MAAVEQRRRAQPWRAIGFALIAAAAAVLIIWRGIAFYKYGLHKKDL